MKQPRESEDDYIDISPYKRKRRSKKSISVDLPIDEEIYRPEETHYPDCGEELKEFSCEVRKELEFEPARFFMRHHITVHCSCPDCNVVQSSAPSARILNRSYLVRRLEQDYLGTS